MISKRFINKNVDKNRITHIEHFRNFYISIKKKWLSYTDENFYLDIFRDLRKSGKFDDVAAIDWELKRLKEYINSGKDLGYYISKS